MTAEHCPQCYQYGIQLQIQVMLNDVKWLSIDPQKRSFSEPVWHRCSFGFEDMFAPWTGLISRNDRSVVGNGNQLKWCARRGPDCFLIVPSTLFCIIWCVVSGESIISKFGEACPPTREDTVWRKAKLCTFNNNLWINHPVDDTDTGSKMRWSKREDF